MMSNESFETDFAEVVKGIPDLERIISRIHAGSCKVKDFLKVLDVRLIICFACAFTEGVL
jgi:DNA mismatch repair protein MSH6